uniref:Uncharacterized protein n=1 Tax=Physcomitrium patens TaxID=3218 RepID=A0A2K1KAW5_PHYPA|nr:hypothetical protein PHYPA_010103 [Physcomitrium patens]
MGSEGVAYPAMSYGGGRHGRGYEFSLPMWVSLTVGWWWGCPPNAARSVDLEDSDATMAFCGCCAAAVACPQQSVSPDKISPSTMTNRES